MSTWIDLYNVVAEYESDVVNITSDFDYYITKISHNYENNDGVVTLEVRASIDDGYSWTDWIDVNMYKPLFDGEERPLNSTKFQYRVTMKVDSLGGISPRFKMFNISWDGTFKVVNYGDVVCKPELWIKKINGSGDIKLTNEVNGLSLEFKDLNNGETVYVDCENEDIMTDLPLKYRYNDHNDVFMELDVGENYLSGEGEFELDMRMEFKTLQG